MNKAHEIVAEFLTNYLRNNNLDKLTEVLASGATLSRGVKYVLDVEKQIAEIKEDVYNAVWYLMEFLQDYQEDIFYKELFVGRYDYGEDDEYVILHIDNHFIKIIYNSDESSLVLVQKEITSFGKIDLNWFNEQIERNFQSNVAEVLQDIKNHITPLETKDVWIEIKSTL